MTTASCTTKPYWIKVEVKNFADLKKGDYFIFYSYSLDCAVDLNWEIHQEHWSLYIAEEDARPTGNTHSTTTFVQVSNKKGTPMGTAYRDYTNESLRKVLAIRPGSEEELKDLNKFKILEKIKYLDKRYEQRKQLRSQKGSVPEMQPSR